MSKALVILFIFLATFQLANYVSSQPISPTFTYAYCNSESYGNYTPNSTYDDNLKTVVSKLATHASIEVFYDTSFGNGTDTVFGQYYCRADVDTTFCGDCIKAASLYALNCSNAKAAIIWYEECTLRYKNESMFGVPEETLVLGYYSLRNMTDPETFSPLLNETISGLIVEAVSGNSSSSVKYFATAEKELSAFVKAYFLVQCSPDLNETQCVSCLLTAFVEMERCCGEWPIWMYSSPPSCQVDYNTNGLFYFTPNAPPPPPFSSSLSPPPPIGSKPPPPPQGTAFQFTPPPKTGGAATLRSGESVKVRIVITILLVFLMLGFNP